jgi:putative Mg2+ transporter-C (MgtC) family protein
MVTVSLVSKERAGLIGMAVAFDRYEIAILMSLINVVTLRYVRHLKQDPDDKPEDA